MALAADMQRSALAHVAEFPCGTYTCPIQSVCRMVRRKGRAEMVSTGVG